MKTQTLTVVGLLPEDYDAMCRILFHVVQNGLNYFITTSEVLEDGP